MASGPKWPCPGTSDMKLRVNGSKRRCGPMKHVALFVEPWLPQQTGRRCQTLRAQGLLMSQQHLMNS